MEEYSDNQMDKTMVNAFEMTYKMIIGLLTIKELLMRYKNIELLYDPYDLTSVEFEDILDDMLNHYISTEEYEKCAKIRDIIDKPKTHIKIMENLMIDVSDSEFLQNQILPDKNTNPIDSLIGKLKSMGQKALEERFRDMMREVKNSEITDSEIWALMTPADRDIFVNNYTIFHKWIISLTTAIRDEYVSRLTDNKPLIPRGDEMDYVMARLNTLDSPNYDKNVVISYMDNYTIISHSNYTKLMEIKDVLTANGVTDIEFRTKKNNNDYTVYSLVYVEDESTPPHPYIPGKKD